MCVRFIYQLLSRVALFEYLSVYNGLYCLCVKYMFCRNEFLFFTFVSKYMTDLMLYGLLLQLSGGL